MNNLKSAIQAVKKKPLYKNTKERNSIVNIDTAKVGDKIMSHQSGEEYVGKIIKIDKHAKIVTVNQENGDPGWYCSVQDNGTIATAWAAWDDKTLLRYLNLNDKYIISHRSNKKENNNRINRRAN